LHFSPKETLLRKRPRMNIIHKNHPYVWYNLIYHSWSSFFSSVNNKHKRYRFFFSHFLEHFNSIVSPHYKHLFAYNLISTIPHYTSTLFTTFQYINPILNLAEQAKKNPLFYNPQPFSPSPLKPPLCYPKSPSLYSTLAPPIPSHFTTPHNDDNNRANRTPTNLTSLLTSTPPRLYI